MAVWSVEVGSGGGDGGGTGSHSRSPGLGLRVEGSEDSRSACGRGECGGEGDGRTGVVPGACCSRGSGRRAIQRRRFVAARAAGSTWHSLCARSQPLVPSLNGRAGRNLALNESCYKGISSGPTHFGQPKRLNRFVWVGPRIEKASRPVSVRLGRAVHPAALPIFWAKPVRPIFWAALPFSGRRH
jgi:hypothetical protein